MDVPQTSQEFIQALGIPVDFRVYEFASNWAEQDTDTIPIAHEIMKRLCEKRVVLTDIKSTTEELKKKKYTREDWFSMNDSPIGLDMIFNPNTVDVDSVYAVVEAVCAELNVQLTNPPFCKKQ